MSNENQILIRVQNFMNYHYPDIPRMLPEVAKVEYNLLREVINLHLAPKPEPIKPIIAMVIKIRVIRGRLYDKSVTLNLSPPKNRGSQPKRKINNALVAQDQKPSN